MADPSFFENILMQGGQLPAMPILNDTALQIYDIYLKKRHIVDKQCLITSFASMGELDVASINDGALLAALQKLSKKVKSLRGTKKEEFLKITFNVPLKRSAKSVGILQQFEEDSNILAFKSLAEENANLKRKQMDTQVRTEKPV